MKFRFPTTLTMAAVIGFPLLAAPRILLLVTSDSSRSAGDVFGSLGSQGSGQAAYDGVGWALVSYGGAALATALLGVAQARLVMGWVRGRDATPLETLRGVAPRLGVLLVTWVCLVPVRALGFGCLTLFVNPLFLVLSPVIAEEARGPWTSVKRACSIASRRYWPFVGLFLLLALANVVIGYSTLMVGVIVSQLVGEGVVARNVVGGLDIAVSIIMMCVNASVASLAYLDARVRTEGLDLQIDLDAYFPAAP